MFRARLILALAAGKSYREIESGMQTSAAIADQSLHLHVVSDGAEAMAFLRHEGVYLRNSPPNLVLLDLNLPRMNGLEILGRMKADRILKKIPVAVLTSSDNPEDIESCYRLHANCYLTKPPQFEEFKSLACLIHQTRGLCGRRDQELWIDNGAGG